MPRVMRPTGPPAGSPTIPKPGGCSGCNRASASLPSSISAPRPFRRWTGRGRRSPISSATGAPRRSFACRDPRQQPLGHAEMGPIEHLAAEADAAGIAGRGEGGDDRAGAVDGRDAGREHAIDDPDLVGVDGELAGKAVAASRKRLLLEAGTVAETGEDAVDRENPGGAGAGEAERPRQAIRIGEPALRIADRLGSDRGGEVLGAPGQGA